MGILVKSVQIVRGEVVQQHRHPQYANRDDGVALTPHPRDWVAHREESVHRHEDEGVDGDVGGHDYQVLDGLAPRQAERPLSGAPVVDRRERYAKHDEQQIGEGEVENQQVCGVSHLHVEDYRENHQEVADEPRDADEREENWHHNGDRSFQCSVCFLFTRVQVRPGGHNFVKVQFTHFLVRLACSSTCCAAFTQKFHHSSRYAV